MRVSWKSCAAAVQTAAVEILAAAAMTAAVGALTAAAMVGVTALLRWRRSVTGERHMQMLIGCLHDHHHKQGAGGCSGAFSEKDKGTCLVKSLHPHYQLPEVVKVKG